jgi:hypothetical protein
MANCPNCGSSHIQLSTQTKVNWGTTTAVYALAEVFDVNVYGVATDSKNVSICLDCGKSWSAESLFRLIKLSENFTGIKLDLSDDQDRELLQAVIPILDKYAKLTNTAKQGFINENIGFGCMFLFTGFLICFALFIILLSVFNSQNPDGDFIPFTFLIFIISCLSVIILWFAWGRNKEINKRKEHNNSVKSNLEKLEGEMIKEILIVKRQCGY